MKLSKYPLSLLFAVIAPLLAHAGLTPQDAYALTKAEVAKAQKAPRFPAKDSCTFVVCIDNGDGTPPIAILDSPILVNPTSKTDLDHRDARTDVAFRGHAEGTNAGKRKLVGMLSTPLGTVSKEANAATAKIAVNLNMYVSLEDVTLVAAGSATSTNESTKKQQESHFYVFAYSN